MSLDAYAVLRMDRMTARGAGIAVLAVLIVTATAVVLIPDLPLTGDVSAAPQDVDAGADGLFYRVDGGENEVYLFGSLHFGNGGMYPLNDTVEETFNASDVLVMEIDMAAQSQDMIDRRMRAQGTYTDRQLMDVIDADTFNTVYEVVTSQGYNRTAVNRMKPWYAANRVSKSSIRAAGYDPDRGSEEYFTERANTRNMTVVGLETVEDQAAAFDVMSDDAQALYLQGALMGYRNGGERMQEMARHWTAGSDTVFLRQRRVMRKPSQSPSMDAFHNALLDEREAAMSQEIIDRLENGSGETYFVVVGSLHLVGDNSIPDRLEENGYTVTDMYGQ